MLEDDQLYGLNPRAATGHVTPLGLSLISSRSTVQLLSNASQALI